MWLTFLVLAMAATPCAADPGRLLYHAESLDGAVLSSHGADRVFNPASVVKVATTLWALERLGAEHRYQTQVGLSGSWDRETGVVDGQLVFEGGGDPDFHAENAFLVARELNRLGVRRVSDGLVVTGPFTIGWERGAERRSQVEETRARMMARRLLAALDPARWDRTARASWEAMCRRRGWDPRHPPVVAIAGGAVAVEEAGSSPLVRHLSSPLPVLLRRFNVYSNNDIIRVADGLGGVGELGAFVRRRLDIADSRVVLATASGEGQNRLTARLTVRLLREFHHALKALQLAPRAVLPVPGCDPGPVGRMFPRLSWGARARTVAVKTGTLRTTDNGVAVLSGFLTSPRHGVVVFCVAAPDAGKRL